MNGTYDCSALLSHVNQEEAKIGPSRHDALNFGHPPAPEVSMFQLVSQKSNGSKLSDAVLAVAYTRRCISAQVLRRISSDDNAVASSTDSEPKPDNKSAQNDAPFLVAHLMPEADLTQPTGQEMEEIISGLTIVALEDLSLVSVAETNSQIIFDEDPKKRRVQFDEPVKLAENTAKIRNLQLRGTVEEQQVHYPRLAIVFGTNLNRMLSVELRWNPETFSVTVPPSEPLEPLPLDPASSVRKLQEQQQLPFCPSGGVDQIDAFVVSVKKRNYSSVDIPGTASVTSSRKTLSELPTNYVWITYGDGTMLRIHHAAFFPSVLGDEMFCNQEDEEEENKPTISLQERLKKRQIPLLLRGQTKIPKKDIGSFSIFPLPKYHPSPLAPLSAFHTSSNRIVGDKEDTPGRLLSDPEEEEEDDEESQDGSNHDDEMKGVSKSREVCEALLFVKRTAATGQDFPTFCFYTSEDHFEGRTEKPEASSSGLSEAPIIGAVIGGIVGAFSWGFGGGPKSTATTAAASAATENKGGTPNHALVPSGYFPNLRKVGSLIQLYAGQELHDAPRQIESCTIDPEGNLAATTDSFGRILLIDLSTKQIVRMWKGFREASCLWLQAPRNTSSSSSSEEQPRHARKSLFLVIHSRQRRIVEVYRVRHGPRVKSIQVGRDAQIVSSKEFCPETREYLSSCYIIHSNTPGGPTTQNMLQKVIVMQEQEGSIAREESQKAHPQYVPNSNPKEAALRLQRLQQLLANTNVPCQLQDVHQALLQIKSLKDLSTCLDRLAVASVLESKMGVTGTEFQKTALSFCRDSLKDAVKNSKGDPASNPHVKLLATKIVYHTQVINAFDILRRFEQSEHTDEDQQVAPRSPWTEEAMGWVSTYDMVNGKRTEENRGDMSNIAKPKLELMRFSTFANACVPPKMDDYANAQGNRKIEVYLSDSSKTRRDILVHIFKPLLGDIFAFNVVNSIFGALGTVEDSDYLLKCFGEWYMTLSAKEAAQKGFYSLYSPMMRWLQEMVTKQLDKRTSDEHEIALEALHTFCAESADLVRAFMLGALCREAVAKAALKKEEKTYGKISSSEKGMALRSLYLFCFFSHSCYLQNCYSIL